MLQAAAQAESIDKMVPELDALRKAVQRLQGVEASYGLCQKELDETKISFAESTEALVLFQAAEQQHKALFGPLANLDPAAMASKLDDTLSELRLIRERQEQVLEQQERVRVNAEKAQLQRDAQEQKAKARQKVLAEKSMQKYSSKAAYQSQTAVSSSGQWQKKEPISSAANSLDAVSSTAESLAVTEYMTMTMTRSATHGLPTEPDTLTAPLLTNNSLGLGLERPTQRRTGIRGPSSSPVPADLVPKPSLQHSAPSLGQTLTRGAAARSASPVFTRGKLQAALQKTLGQTTK